MPEQGLAAGAAGGARAGEGVGVKTVLFAVRSAAALHRLLDVVPVFAGDDRIRRRFTLAPGSDFGVDALAALDAVGGRTVPWDQALTQSYDLVVAASPKGPLERLKGPLVLLPHGAGFNKTLRGEGADDSASGLDPAYLMRDGRPIAELHGLAHPHQIDRLAERCPPAAARTVVVGDPTLDRLLESRTLRDGYRAALGTRDRRLIVLTSTWGNESLLARRPGLPELLATQLPVDEYQLALIAHPNTHSDPGTFDLCEQLPPEVFLARSYEEWAALLVAADAVITDHGSTALYAAALDRPVLAAYDGGAELLPGTPMAQLLSSAPRLPPYAAALGPLLTESRPGVPLAAARNAFAEREHSLDLLRAQLYTYLKLTPPSVPPVPRLLPTPRKPVEPPAAFAVRAEVQDDDVRIERRPVRTDVTSHHLVAEVDASGSRAVESAGLLYRRAPGPIREDWTAEALAQYPSCRTAGVILSPERCVVRRRAVPHVLVSVRIESHGGRLPDPAVVLSAVHALADATEGTYNCLVGDRTYRMHLALD